MDFVRVEKFFRDAKEIVRYATANYWALQQTPAHQLTPEDFDPDKFNRKEQTMMALAVKTMSPREQQIILAWIDGESDAAIAEMIGSPQLEKVKQYITDVVLKLKNILKTERERLSKEYQRVRMKEYAQTYNREHKEYKAQQAKKQRETRQQALEKLQETLKPFQQKEEIQEEPIVDTISGPQKLLQHLIQNLEQNRNIRKERVGYAFPPSAFPKEKKESIIVNLPQNERNLLLPWLLGASYEDISISIGLGKSRGSIVKKQIQSIISSIQNTQQPKRKPLAQYV